MLHTVNAIPSGLVCQFKIVIALLFFFGLQLNASAQQTFNAASSSVMVNGNIFDYSIGEMTLVSTIRNPNLIVTQGFLQPFMIGSNKYADSILNEMSVWYIEPKVYPNPTQRELTIETNEEIAGEYKIQLFDATGKIILSQSNLSKKGINTVKIDLRNYVSGSYFLILQTNNQKDNTEHYSFKIQKIN